MINCSLSFEKTGLCKHLRIDFGSFYVGLEMYKKELQICMNILRDHDCN